MKAHYEVIIIGAGTAGLAALHEVRRHTRSFLIVNDGPYGTTCARVGCMPSKALIEAANTFHRRAQFNEFGIKGAERLSVDVAAVLQRVRQLRDHFVSGVVAATDALGEHSVAGRAQFVAADTLAVNGQLVRASRIIIATGSRPIVPEAWQRFGARILTSDTLFEQPALKPRMAVVGLGAIGVELAQALARLGIDVTAFHNHATVAGLKDATISARMVDCLRHEFHLHLNASAQLQQADDGIAVIADNRVVVVDQVLAALGRRQNTENLGLENLGFALDDQGLPPFNRHSMQVGTLPVYIAGDVSDEIAVLHEAADDGYISGINATRANPECLQRRIPLAIVFADPNVAVIGQRFDVLPAHVIIGACDFASQGRARVAGENHGLLHVYASNDDGRLLGAELCAPRGEHLAHLLALAIARGLTARELLVMPFYHPTFEEGLRTALRHIMKQLGGAPSSDLASCDALGVAALD